MSKGFQLSNRFSTGGFLRLALPMIVSRAGLAAMGIADGIMVAHFGAREFASLSLAEGLLGRVLDVFIAFLIGGLSLVPRHFAQGDGVGARIIWLRTIPESISLGFAGFLVGLSGIWFLAWMGQKPELVASAGRVMLILGAGYPAALLAISAAVFLEGVGRPQFVAACVVTANLLNIALNWVLIGGHLGFPAMGARGSALSTTVVRCALCVALVYFAWRRSVVQTDLSTGKSYSSIRGASEHVQWKLGLGASGTVAAMVVLTASLTVFAGWLGILSLAAFSASMTLAAPAALVALGMADAAGISVAAEAGRHGERMAATVAWASLRTTAVPIAAMVCGLAIWGRGFAALFTSDAGLREAMAPVIPIAAVILLIDSSGFVMAASLRAIREAAWPAGIEIGSMLLLVPLAAVLAFELGYGVRGLFFAMLGAGTVRAAMLAGRFYWCTRAPVPSALVPSRGRAARVWSPNAE